MQLKADLKLFFASIIFELLKKLKLYIIIFIFAIVHEAGHMLMAILLKYKIEKFEINIYGPKLKIKVNYDDYNKKIGKGSLISLKKILIALAGPATNMAISFLIFIISICKIKFFNGRISEFWTNAFYANIIIFVFNMLPIYPLDGGRILQEILHITVGLRKSYSIIQDLSFVSIAILTAVSSIIILYYKNIMILLVLLYLWHLALKCEKEFSLKEKIYDRVEKILKSEKSELKK